MKGRRGGAAAALALATLGLLAVPAARAHPLAPALLEITEGPGGTANVRFKVPRVRARGQAPLAPVLPDGCAISGPVERGVEGTGWVERFHATCDFERWAGRRVGVTGLRGPGESALLRFHGRDGAEVHELLTAATPALSLPARGSALGVWGRYVRLGIDHLLLGPDHLLFVLGLMMLVGGRRRLVATITAFTAGHSLTLALAVLGWVRVPSAPVEAAIAASILAPAVAIARGAAPNAGVAGSAAGARPVWRHPAVWAFAFGWLHGLGFAGALREAGLPAADVPLALFGFNVGIEIGQLLWAGTLGALAWLVHRLLGGALPAVARRGVAYAMGVIAAAWLWQRLGQWLGGPWA